MDFSVRSINFLISMRSFFIYENHHVYLKWFELKKALRVEGVLVNFEMKNTCTHTHTHSITCTRIHTHGNTHMHANTDIHKYTQRHTHASIQQ